MSSKKKIDVSCPNCQHTQSVIIWEALNSTLSPESKQQLVDNQINLLKCENCKTETHLEIDLLYHDMQKEFCAVYISFASLDENSLVFRFNQRGELREFTDNRNDRESYDYMNHPQIVFDMSELVRYVKFRDKLFDDYAKADASDKPIYFGRSNDRPSKIGKIKF